MREGASGIFAKVVLGLVILSFAFAGVGSYINAGGDVAAVVVNGEEIPESAVERAYQNERSRMEAQLGEMFSQLASNPEYMSNFRKQITERLVSEKLLDQLVADVGLRVSDNELKQAIFDTPAFQLGGQFDNERFLLMIRQSGLQVHDFRNLMRGDLTRRQISEAVLTSEFALPSEANNAVKLQKQTRDARFVKVSKELFSNDIEITDDERQTYYSTHIANFDTEEMVKVEYVELKAANLMPLIEVSKEEVEKSYEDNLSRYRSEEQRRVSHILIDIQDDEDASLAEAQGLLDIARTGADFAALAKENSADTFSGENGGDLEWIEKGQMDPAFEEATYALTSVGQLSDVVKSEFGFHIIKLTELKQAEIKELADVQAEIKTELEKEKAAEQFYEIQTQMEELAFEVPDSLDEVALAANTSVQTTDFFSHTTSPADLSFGAVLEMVFSEDAIADKVNSEVLSVGTDHIVVVRVVDHKPRRTQSLDEVKESIDAELVNQKAVEATKNWVNSLKEAILNSEDAEAMMSERTLAWEVHAGVGRSSGVMEGNLTTALFKLSTSDKFDVVELSNGDIALIELQKVNQAENLDPNELSSFGQRLAMQQGGSNFEQMLSALKEQAKIEYLKQN